MGGNVVLSLRKQVQETAYSALLNNKTQSKIGAVVAIDPSTGGILALVSTPSYDPNPLVQHDFDAAKAAYDKLDEDPSKPLNNRALSETFPPGLDLQGDRVRGGAAERADPGRRAHRRRQATPRRIPPRRSATRPGVVCPNQITLQDALRVSCNTAFARYGVEQLGADKLKAVVAGVRLRDRAAVRPRRADNAMRVAASHTGDMQGPDGSVDRPALAQSCIGQREVRWTPLQGALVAATIANDGSQMRPYLIDTLQDAEPRPDLAGRRRGAATGR